MTEDDDDALLDAPTDIWTRPAPAKRGPPAPPHRRRGREAADPDVDVLSADEVAALLRVDRKTVYDGAGRGEIPCRRLGKRILFSRQFIMLWLERKAAS
jgi:excisionase family DNA binding protein